MRGKEETRESSASVPSAIVGCMERHDALTYEGEGASKGIGFSMEIQR